MFGEPPLNGSAFGSTPGIAVLGIEAELIVHLALLGVAQNVVGFLDIFKALFRRFVARIQIGMILARQTPVRLADSSSEASARHSQRFVIVLFWKP